MNTIMEEEVSVDELVARFITGKDYYRPKDGTVKHNAFMPSREGETSVYRTKDLADDEIFEIGRIYFAEKIGKDLKGRADIPAFEVFEKGLAIVSQPTDHSRHASIVDWPQDKSKSRLIAVELAAKAKLQLVP